MTFAGALALICGLTVFIGLAPLRLLEHDIFFLIDNAYRVAQGQVPHRDFSSAWGPLIYLIDATGLLLSRMRPEGIAWANALFAALIGVWAYRVGRARLGSAAGCWMGVYTVLLIAAPFSLGYSPLIFSQAMVYNRYGFALLGIILVECGAHLLGTDAGPGDGTPRTLCSRGAISSGAAFAALAFLKISFAIAAVPILLLGYACGSGRAKRLRTLCAASAIVSTLFVCYLRFDFRDLFFDLAMAANARSKSWNPRAILALGFGHLDETMLLVLLVAAVAMASRSEARAESKWPVRELVLALVTLGVGGVLLSTNNQPGTLPLNAFAALVLGGVYLVRPRPDPRLGSRLGPRLGSRQSIAHAFVVVLLMAICVLRVGMLDAISLAAAAGERLRPDAPAMSLASERGASMTFAPVRSLVSTETGGPEYVGAVNDGIELLRRRTKAPEGALTLDMFNPFNYLLGRRSPRGGLSAAAYNYVFSDAAHPAADRFFGDTRYVLVRKYSRSAGDFAVEQYHIDGLLRIYGAALESRFSLVEETPHWRLYRLRSATEATAAPPRER